MNIFWAETEPFALIALKDFINSLGHKVTQFETVSVLISNASKREVSPDVVFFEYGALGSEGAKTVKRLRELFPCSALIAVGDRESAPAKEIIDCDIEFLLRKPIRLCDIEFILSRISQANLAAQSLSEAIYKNGDSLNQDQELSEDNNLSQIAVVDDDPNMTFILSRMLFRAGHPTVCFNDSVKALEELEKNQFKLVITDLSMPDIDGFEILRRVKQKWPQTEVILVSANIEIVMPEEMKLAYKCMCKPVDFKRLISSVEEVLNREPKASEAFIAEQATVIAKKLS